MNKPLVRVIGSLLVSAASAQSPTGAMTATNGPIIVTATRLPVPEHRAPYFTAALERQALADAQRNSLPESLEEMAGVMVQKTAPGQGSPVIRGFTGFRTLLLVDGVRLNNSVFRDGANQYWSTVDALALERLELVEGPASVLYGSDAVGGAVQALTVDPLYAPEGQTTRGGSLLYRYASASDAQIGRLTGSYAESGTALLAGLSRRIFGDVDAGGDLGEQPETGYDAWDWDLKLRQRLDTDREIVAAWQHTALNDVWRTHKTIYGIAWHGTKVGDELRRSLDQTRDLGYLQYRDDVACAAYDRLQSTLSFQRQSEDQYRVKKDAKGEDQGFDVDTWGATVQMNKLARSGTWVYGAEYYRDGVDSYLHKLRNNGSVSSAAIQGPVADDSTYDTAALYAADTLALAERLDAVVGARGSLIRADAGRYADPVSGEAASMTRDWSDLSGDVRLVQWLTEARDWNLYAGVARAFRAPNLSDLTRLDTARSDEIETASPDVDAEHFLTAEVGTKFSIGGVALQLAGFHTRIDDLIVRTPTGNTIDGLREVTKSNASEGYVHGIVFDGRAPLGGGFTARFGIAWMEGEADSYDQDQNPIREPLRTQPLTADTALRWTAPSGAFWSEVGGTFVDKEDRLSAADIADNQRIPPGGTPGYGVAGIRCGWQPASGLSLVAAVENLGDKDYRVHGSGSNEPGRSFNLSLAYAF